MCRSAQGTRGPADSVVPRMYRGGVVVQGGALWRGTPSGTWERGAAGTDGRTRAATVSPGGAKRRGYPPTPPPGARRRPSNTIRMLVGSALLNGARGRRGESERRGPAVSTRCGTPPLVFCLLLCIVFGSLPAFRVRVSGQREPGQMGNQAALSGTFECAVTWFAGNLLLPSFHGNTIRRQGGQP